MDQWKEDLQALIDEQFENASNIYTIKKFNNVSGLYEDIIVRLDTPYELKQKSSRVDDFRKVIFKDNNITTLIGDSYQFNNSYWICVDAGTIETPTNSCIIQLCTNSLIYYQNNNPQQIPCIISSSATLDTDENKYIQTPSTTIIMRLPNTEVTRQIKRGEIYQIGLQSYVIKDINDIVEPGLLRMEIEFSSEMQILPSYFLTILNGSIISIQQSNTVQLNIQVKDGTTILPTPLPYLFVSSDETICQVSDSGLVTSIGIGTATITCKLQSDETVYDTISITVEEMPIVDDYTVQISGATTVKLNSNITLNANVLNNGIIDSTKSVVWSLRNQDGSVNQYVSIVSQDGDSIELKATSNNSFVGKYVVVRGSLNGDLSVYSEHLVQIKSIF
jgi:hypothetical protein